MAKFNALGSNFTLCQAWRVLWQRGEKNTQEKVKAQVREFFGDENLQVEFFYKGREALRASLRSLKLPAGSKIGVVGFTCLAVIEAIEAEGLQVQLLEIDESLNIQVESVPNNLKGLIIQNTFGLAQPEIKRLIAYCEKNKIILIEDGAHCMGARYATGQLVGTLGQVAFFSSSQDKILDSVAGGLVVSKKQLPSVPRKKVSQKQQQKDRWYPLLTWLIRHTYDWGGGKALHWLARKNHWLSQPMNYDDEGKLHQLPEWQMELLGEQIARLPKNLVRRQQNLRAYLQRLEEKYLCLPREGIAVGRSAGLRLPIMVEEEKREEILRRLRKAGYYLSDFWYDAPVGTKKCLRDYPNRRAIEAQFVDIPRARQACRRVLNLPLHQEMTERDIERICEIVQS